MGRKRRKPEDVSDEEIISHLTQGGLVDMNRHRLVRYPWNDRLSRVQIIDGREFVEMNDDDALETACLNYLERVGTPLIIATVATASTDPRNS